MIHMSTTSPTDIRYFANHDSDTLRRIVERYTADSFAMAANGGDLVAADAMGIANNAWFELALRGEA